LHAPGFDEAQRKRTSFLNRSTDQRERAKEQSRNAALQFRRHTPECRQQRREATRRPSQRRQVAAAGFRAELLRDVGQLAKVIVEVNHRVGRIRRVWRGEVVVGRHPTEPIVPRLFLLALEIYLVGQLAQRVVEVRRASTTTGQPVRNLAPVGVKTVGRAVVLSNRIELM